MYKPEEEPIHAILLMHFLVKVKSALTQNSFLNNENTSC